LVARLKLPAVYSWREFADAGGLMSYGPSLPDTYRQSARLVDKILKRAKPGDLPFELATRYELIVNLKTAKAMGFNGAVAGVVGIEVGVVSGVFNLESSGVDAPDWRPRHEEH
jgi:ABC-type uncharacterized transport system substrate-binding protein